MHMGVGPWCFGVSPAHQVSDVILDALRAWLKPA